MKIDTLLAHAGRAPERFEGLVNAPICRASTILHPTMASFKAAAADKHAHPYYGRYGTATTRMLEEACSALDGGDGAVLFPSGLAASTNVLDALATPGAHILVVDSVYGPVRDYCETALAARGVAVTWYAPCIGAQIESMIRAETRVIYCESPGSLTFEVQDLPAICQAATRHDVAVVVDNTWATPYFCRPLALGASVSIQAATKYLVGHSDAMLGVAVATERYLKTLRTAAARHGNSVSADDCALGLRGIRTLGVRLRQHFSSATRIARWMQQRPETRRVLYPALPEDPGHSIWQRDFAGACGLFGVELQAVPDAAVDAFVDNLELFGIGVSWGGFESLVLPSHPKRTLRNDEAQGPLLRIHIGLEDPDDLIEDLAGGLDRYIAPSLPTHLQTDAA